MTTDQWLVVANLGTVVVAVVTVFLGLKGVRDQLRTATFLAYTKRYGKIMRRLPFDARRPGSKFHLHELSEPERENVLAAYQDYINLCSEEWWLAGLGRVDKRTWNVWKGSISQVMRHPCFDEIWGELEHEYAAFPEFVAFMNGLRAAR
jgi:hypothetical protein